MDSKAIAGEDGITIRAWEARDREHVPGLVRALIWRTSPCADLADDAVQEMLDAARYRHGDIGRLRGSH